MTVRSATSRLQDRLESSLDELAGEATEVIFAELPVYRAASGAVRKDVTEHVLSHYRAITRSFREARDVTEEDLLFVRAHAAARVRRVPIADFIHAFQIGQRVLWAAARALARDDASRQAALALADHLPRYFEVATTHATEVYLEAEQEVAATGEAIRRDLLDDLLAGRPIPSGPLLEAAQAVGLQPGSSCLVVAALCAATPADEHALRGAAASLARAVGGAVQPLTVIRHHEIVVVAAARADAAGPLRRRLAQAQQRLSDGGLPLTMGVSTVVAGLEQIPEAYREAEFARAALRASAGVIALGDLTAFEYLTLHDNPTARRLIAPRIRDFIAQDTQDGGALIATLREYVASDLNARLTAERLHIHVNTAHYRLGKIAERTGCDVRSVPDLIEVLIAARLAGAPEPA